MFFLAAKLLQLLFTFGVSYSMIPLRHFVTASKLILKYNNDQFHAWMTAFCVKSYLFLNGWWAIVK